MVQAFGKRGHYYFDIARGIDDRPVNPHRIRKSLAVERTMDNDLENFDEILPVLLKIIDKFYERLRKADNFGRTLTLKLKTSEFQILTRSLSKEYYIKDKSEITKLAIRLLKENIYAFDKIRLIGLTASNLEKEEAEGGEGQLKFEWE